MTEEEFDDLKAEARYLKKKSGEAREAARQAEQKLNVEKAKRAQEYATKRQAVIDAERRRFKVARDAEIRSILLPMAERMMETGWRIRITHSGQMVWNGKIPLFEMYKSGDAANSAVPIYWSSGFDRNGFEWQ